MILWLHLEVKFIENAMFTVKDKIQVSDTHETMKVGRFDFKICPSIGIRADGDGLEDTQEVGGFHGYTPPHSVKVKQ